MKIISALLLAISMTSMASASELRYYDVELVIFENLSSTDRNNESWSIDGTLLLPENSLELGRVVTQDRLPAGAIPRYSYTLLPTSKFQLGWQMDKINKSSSRRVLLHTAWRQPGLDSQQAPYLHFRRDIAAGNGEAEQQLEGLVRVTLSRYLHLETELVLGPRKAQPDSPDYQGDAYATGALNESGEQLVYRHKQIRRRMRSGEMHYLDHPVIGMLVKITPFDPDEKKR